MKDRLWLGVLIGIVATVVVALAACAVMMWMGWRPMGGSMRMSQGAAGTAALMQPAGSQGATP